MRMEGGYSENSVTELQGMTLDGQNMNRFFVFSLHLTISSLEHLLIQSKGRLCSGSRTEY